MTRLKFAELTSGIGALVLGVGLGALFPSWFSDYAGLMVFAGAVAHACGMWDKHRLEGQGRVETSRAVLALYWACWLLLAATVGFLIIRR